MANSMPFAATMPFRCGPPDGEMRAGHLRGFFELVSSYGADPRAIMERHTIDPVAFADPDSYVDCSAAVNMLEYCAERFNDRLFAKVGLFLLPVGMLNESHEPTRYYGVFRNQIETAIIPTTWREGGVQLLGSTDAGLSWNVGLTTGFNLNKWDATSQEGRESPLGAIHQELALASARDLSGFLALNYTGVPGLKVGASLFSGGASQGQSALGRSRVTLWETHARWTPAQWELSALYARGRISDTARANLLTLGSLTPIPQSFFGWYAEAAYRGIERGNWSLTPFLRYERFNTAASFADLGAGLTPAAARDGEAITGGVNWMIAPGVVIKADYLNFRRGSGDNRYDLGLGYQF